MGLKLNPSILLSVWGSNDVTGHMTIGQAIYGLRCIHWQNLISHGCWLLAAALTKELKYDKRSMFCCKGLNETIRLSRWVDDRSDGDTKSIHGEEVLQQPASQVKNDNYDNTRVQTTVLRPLRQRKCSLPATQQQFSTDYEESNESL